MNRHNSQQGMTLVLVMVLILPLTLMAITMMQSGREQLKMSSAMSHGFSSQVEIEGKIEMFWLENMIHLSLPSILKHESRENIKVVSEFTINKNYRSSCARSLTVSSSNIIKQCHYLIFSSPTSDGTHITGQFVAEQPLVLSDRKSS